MCISSSAGINNKTHLIIFGAVAELRTDKAVRDIIEYRPVKQDRFLNTDQDDEHFAEVGGPATCCTMRILDRSHRMFNSLISMPSRSIFPLDGSYHLSSKPVTVLLPEPLLPMSAVVLLAGIKRSRFLRTGTCGREG